MLCFQQTIDILAEVSVMFFWEMGKMLILCSYKQICDMHVFDSKPVTNLFPINKPATYLFLIWLTCLWWKEKSIIILFLGISKPVIHQFPINKAVTYLFLILSSLINNKEFIPFSHQCSNLSVHDNNVPAVWCSIQVCNIKTKLKLKSKIKTKCTDHLLAATYYPCKWSNQLSQ